MKSLLTTFTALTIIASVNAQSNQQKRADEVQLNTITTAVPFLQISPDSRAGAMGDAGVGLSPDANSTHWNPSKLAFLEDDFGVSLSYAPWLRTIVPDMSLSYLSGFKKLTANSAVGASLRYFSLGEITFTDETGQVIRLFKPSEFAIDGSYALKLSQRLSVGATLRYVRSNLTGGSIVQGAETKAGNSVAFDISGFYRSGQFKLADKDARLNFGLNISNVGNKMNYTTSSTPDFIPTMLRLGPALELNIDEYNAVNFSLELSKLLVPTPPIYEKDSSGQFVIDPETQQRKIAAGKNPEVTVAEGIMQSFGDAPGGGKEEFREINLGFGAEYLYNKQIAVRAGYFYESPTKGARQYITMGAGFKYQVLNIDLSYLISTTNNNPLANTLRVTLRFNFAKAPKEEPGTPAANE